MLEALRDAAGRRVARPDDVASWVEQISGPFIRARRREASVSLGGSDSEIRPTERDTKPDESEDPTLSRVGEASDPPTEVDITNPLSHTRGLQPRTRGVPRLTNPEDEDEEEDVATQVVEMPLEAEAHDPTLPTERRAPQHPADGDKPTRTVDVSMRLPSEAPSVISTLPPAKSELLVKRAGLPVLSESSPEADTYEDESVTEPRGPNARQSQQSITLEMPATKGELENVYTGDLATEKRQAVPPSAVHSLTRTARSPGTAPSDDDQETVDLAPPDDARAILDEANRKAISGKHPRPLTEEELAETAPMDRAVDSRARVIGAPRTSSIAMPTGGGPLATSVPIVDRGYPQYPHHASTLPAPSPSDPRALVVPAPPRLPSAPLQPALPDKRFSSNVSTTRGRGGSFLLGALTFFLVLASLVIVAWLTMPYWRPYVEL
jgi:hypothetical protein